MLLENMVGSLINSLGLIFARLGGERYPSPVNTGIARPAV
jgi:hypothetical protein